MKKLLLLGLVFSLWLGAEIPIQGADATYNTTTKMVVHPEARPAVLLPANVWAGVPTAIKVVPPEGMKVTEYLVKVEKKAANGIWSASPAEPFAISAARAESDGGYPSLIVSSPGTWRLAVMAFRPAQSGWSVGVEFTAIAVPSTSPTRTPAKK